MTSSERLHVAVVINAAKSLPQVLAWVKAEFGVSVSDAEALKAANLDSFIDLIGRKREEVRRAKDAAACEHGLAYGCRSCYEDLVGDEESVHDYSDKHLDVRKQGVLCG